MELTTRKKLVLTSGRTHPQLAEDIAGRLGVPLTDPDIVDFASGELRPKFTDSLRGTDVFVVQTHARHNGHSVNDAVMEQLIVIDAAKRASAKRITAVCPFYGYSRQDRKASGREPITARLVADMMRVAGADRIISVDLHSGQIQGFFNGPVDHLTAMPMLVDHLVSAAPDGFVVAAPDAGRVSAAERVTRHIHADLAIVHKRRSGVNKTEALAVIGDVDGRLCVLVDDMIDTAGTIVSAAEMLKEAGAREVWAAATHAVLSGPAVERLSSPALDRVVVTDTVPVPDEKRLAKMTVLSAADVLAGAILAVFSDDSVSALFPSGNQF